MEVNAIVAQNLRAVREKKKLSLDNVAKLTGVSKSMLGQIERGEVNPTITVLWKIANGLKISFTSLLDKNNSDVDLIKKADVQTLVEDDGKFYNSPVFPFEESRRFEIYVIDVKPGGGLVSEPHMQGTEEYITMFSGKLDVTINDCLYSLDTGDSIRFKSDVNHAYHNPGNEDAKLHMVIYYER